MAYIGKSPTGTGVRQRYYFTATGGETSLSGTDDNGLTLSYSDGAYVDVLLNGIELVAGTDYNTSTANTIAGLSALAANDVVTVTVYDIFTVADTVSAKNGGTFSGNVGLAGNDLILDADADSKIEASTDDTINIISGGTTGLTVDSSGRVLLPQLPCASVGLSTGNTNDTSNPYTHVGVIIFDEVYVNQGSVYDTSNGRFTAPVDGIYELSSCLLQDDDGTLANLDIRFSKNGTDINLGSNPYSGNDTKYHQVSYTRLIDLSANDYLQLKLHTGGIFITANNYYNVVNFRLVG